MNASRASAPTRAIHSAKTELINALAEIQQAPEIGELLQRAEQESREAEARRRAEELAALRRVMDID